MTSTYGNCPSSVVRRNAINNGGDTSREPVGIIFATEIACHTRRKMSALWTDVKPHPYGTVLNPMLSSVSLRPG